MGLCLLWLCKHGVRCLGTRLGKQSVQGKVRPLGWHMTQSGVQTGFGRPRDWKLGATAGQYVTYEYTDIYAKCGNVGTLEAGAAGTIAGQ
eukprot:4501066-Ditylum_brightwellii.AAC.1